MVALRFAIVVAGVGLSILPVLITIAIRSLASRLEIDTRVGPADHTTSEPRVIDKSGS